MSLRSVVRASVSAAAVAAAGAATRTSAVSSASSAASTAAAAAAAASLARPRVTTVAAAAAVAAAHARASAASAATAALAAAAAPSPSASSSSASASALSRRGLSADPQQQQAADAAKYVLPEPLDAAGVAVERTAAPGVVPPNEQLVFGKTPSDHLLEVDWVKGEGWSTPRIRPYGPFAVDPASTVLHYGSCVFEGMKAYKDQEGRVRLFRPDRNMARMNASCARLCLPNFDDEGFQKLLETLLRLDQRWVPEGKGYSLYIRPTMIGTMPFLGVAPPTNAKLFIMTCPVGPYYPGGFVPVSLLASDGYLRAWPGGTGNAKVGGNYAPGLLPQLAAADKGYDQVLWLFKDEQGQDQITEVGTMNLFVFHTNKDGERELVTAPLDGTILPGVTRSSVLDIAREWGEFKVSERAISMQELVEDIKDGRLIEVFGSGTAAIVSPVNAISYEGTRYDIPLRADDPDAKIGVLAERMVDEIMAIQYGERGDHPWSVVVPGTGPDQE